LKIGEDLTLIIRKAKGLELMKFIFITNVRHLFQTFYVKKYGV
jgi:hypothetical protein